MEFLKTLSPELRRKINIGLLIFTGVQLFAIFILAVFFSGPEPRPERPMAARPPVAVPVAAPAVAPAAQPKKQAKTKSRNPSSQVMAHKPGKNLKSGRKLAHAAKQAPRKLPPMKVAKQVRHASPSGKQSDNWKVVAKAPSPDSKSHSN